MDFVSERNYFFAASIPADAKQHLSREQLHHRLPRPHRHYINYDGQHDNGEIMLGSLKGKDMQWKKKNGQEGTQAKTGHQCFLMGPN